MDFRVDLLRLLDRKIVALVSSPYDEPCVAAWLGALLGKDLACRMCVQGMLR